MSEFKKSFWTAAAVVLGATLLVGGNTMRDRVDLGAGKSGESSLAMEGLVASRGEQGTEVPEGAFFREMLQLLKREYVDPLDDESKLASGAVRGMVQSLDDTECLFLDSEEFAAHRDALKGRYQGIGVDLTLMNESIGPRPGANGEEWRVARLVVAGVAPGGAADRAGVKVGDWVESVDGHWVVNARAIKRFQEQQKLFSDGKLSEEEFRKGQKAMRELTERSVMPVKARKKLVAGTSGKLDVVWNRGDQKIETQLERSVVEVPALRKSEQGWALRFQPGVEKELAGAIEGQTELTLDLRGSALGDLGAMRACLELLAAPGTYGVLSGGPAREAELLKVAKGPPKPPSVRLLVDSGTRGVAEIFALALASKGAKLVGTKTAGAPYVVDTIELPTGDGYTLATAVYVRDQVKEAKSS